jgi:flagellar protein FliO/FliZ
VKARLTPPAPFLHRTAAWWRRRAPGRQKPLAGHAIEPSPSVGDHGVPLDPSLSLKALVALGAVVLLAFAALRALRAVTVGGARPGGGGRRLAVQEVLPLDPKRRLVLVRCDGRELLLLTGGTGEVSLGWIPAPMSDAQ